MKPHPDLEITLDRTDDEHDYRVDMLFSDPSRDVRINPLVDAETSVSIRLDPELLRPLESDPAAYGQQLSAMLFTDPVRTAYARVVGEAGSGEPLRLRLHIRNNANSLHSFRWETMTDPLKDGQTLMTSQSVLFSRFIASGDFRRTDSRSREDQRALIVVANPKDLNRPDLNLNLAPLEVESSVARARSALGDGIETKVLDSSGQPTIENIFTELNDGYDILYLVAHGRLSKSGQPFLILENEDGELEQISGTKILEEFYAMVHRPRLVVLAACETAGRDELEGNEQALTALGPLLAREGIPAVLAMQGQITVDTAQTFMEAFFTSLKDQQEIDTAVAVARNRVRQRPDWWRPVLYMRSRTGQMSYYTAGFSPETRDFDWDLLVKWLKKEQPSTTPIIGAGLAEPLFGTRRQLAQAWSKEEREFPLAPRYQDDLPQVAQYMDIKRKRKYLVDEFVSYLCQTIRKRHERYLGDDLLAVRIDGLDQQGLVSYLNKLIKAVWEKHHARNPYDPYQALAKLNLPIYVTTAPSDLLTTALKLQGKTPRVNYCPWRGEEFDIDIYDDQESVEPLNNDVPTKEEPLVYHLFGGLRNAKSLVLTEDDYFDFLIGITRHHELIPASVRMALVSRTMLILGLRLDSWESRIIFRMLMNEESNDLWLENTHVAAQVAPEAPNVRNPRLAQEYLEDYFGQGSISIFWGKPEDFVRQLKKRLKDDSA